MVREAPPSERVDLVDLVQHELDRDVVGADLVQHRVDGADHLFTGQAQEVGEALSDLLGDFE